MANLVRLLALVLAALAWPAAAAPRAPLVLAAASLQEAMNDAATAWARMGHPRPVLSFAASSALARQAAAGGGADLFVSADEPWMDYVAKAGAVVPGTRADVASGRLVVVARRPVPSVTAATLGARLAAGPLAMADPDAVPAGRYGKAALTSLGVWPKVAPRIVRAESVRAALALVERGAAPFGIIYATDAQASPAVAVAYAFPPASHPPIRYPVARLRGGASPKEAEGFRRFLLSPAGQAILAHRGFSPPR